MRISSHLGVCVLAITLVCHTAAAKPKSVAVVGFDALGMDPERVARLETLFIKEVERLTTQATPGPAQLAKLPRRVRNCDGSNDCLARIGRALGTELVISGNVASLGDAFVLNVKAIDSASGKESRKAVSDPLRGSPDELIEAIRVAAYRLLSPEELHGSLSILADREGAIVELDGKAVGTTPLAEPLSNLPLGEHKLRVSAGEFGEYEDTVNVRFQKTTRVVVSLVDLRVRLPEQPLEVEEKPRPFEKRFYQKTWFLVSAGVAALLIGGYVGYSLAQDEVVSCSEDPSRCMP